MKLLGVLAAGLALGCFTPAAAAEVPAASAPVKADNEDVGDPNRRICRTEKILGSRLGKTRRCLTAAQWSEAKSADRQVIERVQNQRHMQND